MKKYAKIVNEETKLCEVGLGDPKDTYAEIEEDGETKIITVGDYYESLGMTEMEVEESYNGNWYIKGHAPQPSIEYRNEQIRQQRQARYVSESDPIRFDYDEASARGEETAEKLKQEWLSSKDKIREELPYIKG